MFKPKYRAIILVESEQYIVNVAHNLGKMCQEYRGPGNWIVVDRVEPIKTRWQLFLSWLAREVWFFMLLAALIVERCR